MVVDVDLEKFFDRVNHDILMERLSRRIDDKAVLRLIRRYLVAGIMDGGVVVLGGQAFWPGFKRWEGLFGVIWQKLTLILEKASSVPSNRM